MKTIRAPKVSLLAAIKAGTIRQAVLLMEQARELLEREDAEGCRGPLMNLNTAIAGASARQQRVMRAGAKLLPMLAALLLTACGTPTGVCGEFVGIVTEGGQVITYQICDNRAPLCPDGPNPRPGVACIAIDATRRP